MSFNILLEQHKAAAAAAAVRRLGYQLTPRVIEDILGSMKCVRILEDLRKIMFRSSSLLCILHAVFHSWANPPVSSQAGNKLQNRETQNTGAIVETGR